MIKRRSNGLIMTSVSDVRKRLHLHGTYHYHRVPPKFHAHKRRVTPARPRHAHVDNPTARRWSTNLGLYTRASPGRIYQHRRYNTRFDCSRPCALRAFGASFFFGSASCRAHGSQLAAGPVVLAILIRGESRRA